MDVEAEGIGGSYVNQIEMSAAHKHHRMAQMFRILELRWDRLKNGRRPPGIGLIPDEKETLKFVMSLRRADRLRNKL